MDKYKRISTLMEKLVRCGMNIGELEMQLSDYSGSKEEEIIYQDKILKEIRKIDRIKNEILKGV